MVSIVSELELCSMERMSRPELVEAIQARANGLPVELLWQLEEQSIHYLQLLLLAGRLIRVLQHARKGG